MTLGGILMKNCSTNTTGLLDTWGNNPYLRRSRKVWFILFLKDLGLVSNDNLAYARQIHWSQGV